MGIAIVHRFGDTNNESYFFVAIRMFLKGCLKHFSDSLVFIKNCGGFKVKIEIEKLRDKAAVVAEHFANRADFYVRSGSGIFNLNHNDFSDVFTEQSVAEMYLQKFQWYLDESPLIEELEIDIKKEAAEFSEHFAALLKRLETTSQPA